MAKTTPFIRDDILLDRSDFLLDMDPNADVVRLFARRVRLAPGLVLQLGDRPVVIVADEIDGQGGLLDGRGRRLDGPAAAGADGKDEGQGFKGGQAGQNGAPGGPGATVTLVCRRWSGLAIDVSGGAGQDGGPGGRGGAGRDARHLPGTGNGHTVVLLDGEGGGQGDPGTEPPARPVRPNGATAGGHGGLGGRGGAGGAGGRIEFHSLADLSGLRLASAGGDGGAEGARGAPGRNGRGYVPPPPVDDAGSPADPLGGPPAEPPPSRAGAPGADGTVIARQLPDEAAYLAQLKATLGPYANYWAPYRIAMGEFHFRRFKPALDDDAGQRAAAELQAALALQPDNPDALRMQRQLDLGQNVLGLPQDLDIRPLFDSYAQAYAAYAGLSLQFLQIATGETLSALRQQALVQQIDQQVQASRANEARAADVLRQAQSELQAAQDEVTYRQDQLDQIKDRIKAATEAVQEQPFSLFGLLGTLGSLGAAVVGVIAAVPTAGASLLALAPSVVSLGESVLDHSDDVTKALFKHSQPVPKEVADKYAQVGQQVEKVVAFGKQVVDFVKLAEALTQGSTPDNSAYLGLVRQGAVAAHDLLLAQRQVELQQLRLAGDTAAQQRVLSATQDLLALQQQQQHTADDLQAAAHLTLRVAQSRMDLILGFAFQAQRALEILTATDQSGLFDFTAGSLHPDQRRNFEERLIDGPGLLGALPQSWGQLLGPAQLVARFQAFQGDPQRDHDVWRLSASQPAQLRALREERRLVLELNAQDPALAGLQAKVTNVAVALIGARSRSGALSCDITHGARYGQVLERGGAVRWQLLQERSASRLAGFTALAADPALHATTFALGDPLDLAYWGRGLGGTWTLSIRDEQWHAEAVDLSDLSEIQLWIGYQFLRA